MNVYVIASAGGMCKIGMSIEPEERLRALVTGHPYKLRLAYIFPCSTLERSWQVERLAHLALHESRMKGEWFSVSPEEAAATIEAIVAPPRAGPVDCEAFKQLQAQIGCTNEWLATVLDVKPLTITRWRTGRVGVTGPAAVAMKALATGWRP